MRFLEEELFSETDLYWIALIYYIIIISSCIASLLLIITCFVIKCHREHLGKMIIMLGLAGFIFAFPFWVLFQSTVGCFLSDALYTYGSVACAIWAVCFAHQLKICAYDVKVDTRQIFLRYLISSQIIALLWPLFGFIYSSTEMTSNGCVNWVPVAKFSFYIFLQILAILLSFGAALTYYIISMHRLKQIIEQFHIATNGMFGLVLLLPVFMLILRLPMLVVSLLLFFGVDVNMIVLNVSFDLAYLQPFCNAVAFFFTPRVRIGIRNFLRRKTRQNNKLAEHEPNKNVLSAIDTSLTNLSSLTTPENVIPINDTLSSEDTQNNMIRTNSAVELSPVNQKEQ